MTFCCLLSGVASSGGCCCYWIWTLPRHGVYVHPRRHVHATSLVDMTTTRRRRRSSHTSSLMMVVCERTLYAQSSGHVLPCPSAKNFFFLLIRGPIVLFCEHLGNLVVIPLLLLFRPLPQAMRESAVHDYRPSSWGLKQMSVLVFPFTSSSFSILL